MTIIWGYNLEIFNKTGLTFHLKFPLNSHCNALITGASGSGKSYALLYLLLMLLRDCPDIVVYFCDFKNSEDFIFLEDYPHYYRGNQCYDGIMAYYNAFTEIREKRLKARRYILICDEYPSFINYLQGQDKINKTKYANDILGAVSEILMLGRGTGNGCSFWCVTQRADSSLFNNGARDNFMIICALGRLSKEQKGMVLSGEDIPDYIFQQGEGVLLADGHPLQLVKFPVISDISKWKLMILHRLSQSGSA